MVVALAIATVVAVAIVSQTSTFNDAALGESLTASTSASATSFPSLARVAWDKVNKVSAHAWLSGPVATAVSYLAVKSKALREVAIHSAVILDTATPSDDLTLPKNNFHRTYSGANNNVQGCPFMGSRGQPFGRNTFVVSSPNVSHPLPDVVADTFFARKTFQEASIINMWVPAWIQFLVHDIVDHIQDTDSAPLVVGNQTVFKTKAAPGQPTVYPNSVNHFLDGSQLYGGNRIQGAALRNRDGTLSLPNDYLPLDGAGVELLGHPKNVWFGLSMVTYVMALEHNALVKMFQAKYPAWNGDERFDKARLVISALIAKIQGLEWTKAAIQNEAGQYGQDHMFYGLLGKKSRKVLGVQRWLGNFASGIWGGNLDYQNVVYGTTEEFASVYRMHSLLPETFTVRSAASNAVLATMSFDAGLFEGSARVNLNATRLDMAYSLGTSFPGALVLNNYPSALRSMRPQGYNHSIDLAAVDIIRDRERGVPRYNAFRRSLLLNPIKTWQDLTSDPDVIRKLQKVYGNDVELLDLLVGTTAEKKLPGFVFGETIYTVFVVQTQRRIECDRFLTEDLRPEVYTQEGYDWVEQTTFSAILLRHFPSLQRYLNKTDNAFLPWKAKQ